MSNLYSGQIATDGDYETVASLTELTLTSGTTYTLQLLGAAYVREGSTGKGFYICDNGQFQFTAGDDDLYVRTNPGEKVYLNIAD